MECGLVTLSVILSEGRWFDAGENACVREKDLWHKLRIGRENADALDPGKVRPSVVGSLE